jgi:hypothetical protein
MISESLLLEFGHFAKWKFSKTNASAIFCSHAVSGFNSSVFYCYSELQYAL